MSTPLRILIVEDSTEDATLLVRELRHGGYDPVHERVDTPETMLAALDREPWDVVIADYSMPHFSAPAALALVQERRPDLPFIVVSGTIGEELAVEVMKGGADDYVMKENLARLAPAIARELREAEERRARARAEEALHRRDAVLQAIGSAAEVLLRESSWQHDVQRVLARLGEATGASRAYIAERHPGPTGAGVASLRYEWTAPGTPSLMDGPSYQGFTWRGLGLARWEETLSRGGLVHGSVRDFPESERAFLGGHDVRSVAVAPIWVGREWWGAIGFSVCGAERDWSSAELDAIKAAAGTLGAAIQRNQVEERIQHQVERLAGADAINRAIGASLDLGVTLNIILDQVTTQLRVHAAAVLLLKPRTQTLEHAARRGFRTASLQHTRLRLGEGHAGRAAMERRVVSIPDLRHGMGSLARAPFLVDEGFVAYYSAPLIAKGQLKGVLELFHRSPLDPSEDWLDLAQRLASQAAVAIDNGTLFDDLQRSNLELTLAYDTTLEGWSRALDLRDKETEGHSRRVTEMTLRLAEAIGVGDSELVHVRRGALLHDIGKMGIPDGILLKPGPLTEEEWEIMRRHPTYAYELLFPIDFLRPALDIPYCHHEKWDGTGYPRGLRGEAIPLSARIFAIVDVWDAMRSDRPYRAGRSESETLAHIASIAGTHFDPRLVEVFLSESFRAQSASHSTPELLAV